MLKVHDVLARRNSSEKVNRHSRFSAVSKLVKSDCFYV